MYLHVSLLHAQIFIVKACSGHAALIRFLWREILADIVKSNIFLSKVIADLLISDIYRAKDKFKRFSIFTDMKESKVFFSERTKYAQFNLKMA